MPSTVYDQPFLSEQGKHKILGGNRHLGIQSQAAGGETACIA
jgi:hypothetical protein